jgi:hypothetical protein
MLRAPGGNFSKSLRAALIHEMGRVYLVMSLLRELHKSVVKCDNECQDWHRSQVSQARDGAGRFLALCPYGIRTTCWRKREAAASFGEIPLSLRHCGVRWCRLIVCCNSRGLVMGTRTVYDLVKVEG